MDHLSRRIFLAGALGGAASAAFANAPTTALRPAPRPRALNRVNVPTAEMLVGAAQLSGDHSFAVADVRTGEFLEMRGGSKLHPPASVAKAVTALFALDALGVDHVFHTRLLATGPISGGVIQGDLVLLGGADPTLDTDALAEMAQRLRSLGVTGVTGRFIVSDGGFPYQDEISDDQPVQVGYNPSVSGLNLNYNRVHFEWRRGSGRYAFDFDARARKNAPKVNIATMKISDRRVPIYTHRHENGIDRWSVASHALGKGGSRWLPVRRSDLYAAEVFRALAAGQGVSLPVGTVTRRPAKGTVIVDHVSPPMDKILRDMLRFSTNLTAEVVGLAASGIRNGGTRASGRSMTRWTKDKLGFGRSSFVDHSGLGSASKLSAQEMVGALLRTRYSTALPELLRDIPMRNAKGKVLPDHPIKIRAKTGTLNFVSALSGYMTARDGREMAFAIFSADLAARAKIASQDGDVPAGSRAWRAKAKRLQLQLIDRWGSAYVG